MLAESKLAAPATAACFAVVCTNSLLVIVGICSSKVGSKIHLLPLPAKSVRKRDTNPTSGQAGPQKSGSDLANRATFKGLSPYRLRYFTCGLSLACGERLSMRNFIKDIRLAVRTLAKN